MIRKIIVLLLFIFCVTFHTNVSADIKEQSAKEYRDLGYQAQQRGDFQEAYTYYKKAVALGLKTAGILNDLGVLSEQLGFRGKAKRLYLESIQTDPKYLPPYMNVAYVYKSMGDRNNAFKYFKKRFERSSLNDRWGEKAKREMLLIYPQYRDWALEFEAKQLETEIRSTREMKVDDNLKIANEYYLNGRKYFKKGKYKEAMQQFEQASQYAPNNKNLLVAIERTAIRMNER